MKPSCQTYLLGRRWLATLLAFTLLVSCPSNLALASGGFDFVGPRLPNNTVGFSTQSGLQIKVDSSWVGNRGYWPFQVQVSSPTASAADRQITIRFVAGGRYSQPRAITVEQDFELAQGDAAASIKLLVPQLIDWNVCGIEVWVDGILDKQLSQLLIPFNRTNNNASIALFMPRRSSQINLGSAFEEQVADGRIDVVAGNSELPETWLDYSTVDVVVATPEDLQEWKTETPARFYELLRWIRVGGNLWIADAGSELTRLPDVERTLGLPVGQQLPAARSSDFSASGWQYLPLQGSATTGVDALLNLQSPGLQDASLLRRPPRIARGRIDLAVDSRRWFVARAFGMGTVTVYRTPSNRTLEIAIEAVDRSLLAERIAWGRRHGNDPGAGNHEFNNFLIPDVGMAPVFEFQVLISLFVIGIGPVNYWLLKRRGQLPLLLVTVPAAALATTLVLFAYGFLTEGIGTRVRVRSFTMLDQQFGEAVCWARLSYYAGIAPTAGLHMPADAAVYPILPSSGGNYRLTRRYADQARELSWSDPSSELPQHLTRGWLAARIPTQYLTIASRPTNKRIDFEYTDGRLVATNQLGVDVTTLAVQDEAGKLYLVEKIAAGESVPLPTSDKVNMMTTMRALLASHEPQFPAGGEAAARRSYNTESLSRNLMETELAALTSPMVQAWGSRTYVAITAQGVELDLGLEHAIEQDSCHVIRGSW